MAQSNEAHSNGVGGATGDAWKTLIEQLQQQQHGVDPKDQKDFDEFIKSGNKIRILVTGATGVGKSTLLNGIIGKKIFETGRRLEPVTKQVKPHPMKVEGVDIIVFDSPGLHDGLGRGKENKYVQEMVKEIKAYDGIDLILYCKQMDSPNVNIEVEKDIIQKLTDGLGQLKDDRGKRGCIGKDIWHRSLFVLTFANVYERVHAEDPLNIETAFKKRMDEWKELYKEAMNGCGIHVPVRVCPAGYLNPKLCVSEHWLSDFWAAAFDAMAESGAVALVRLNQHRIVETAPEGYGERQRPEDQPIVLTKKVQNVLNIKTIAGTAGAVGVAGAATGAAIGATIGAVGLGVISFGPAATAGLFIGGIIGGLAGAAAAGGIATAWQRHKAKKGEAKSETCRS